MLGLLKATYAVTQAHLLYQLNRLVFYVHDLTKIHRKQWFEDRQWSREVVCAWVVTGARDMKFGIRGQLIDVITCQIFSRSVQGLRSSDTPKIAISHRFAASPLQQCSTAVRNCDWCNGTLLGNDLSITFKWKLAKWRVKWSWCNPPSMLLRLSKEFLALTSECRPAASTFISCR